MKVTREHILDVIVAHMIRNGFPPTVREIGDAVGLKSSSSVESRLRQLELDGLIERGANGEPRTIRVPGVRYVDERWKL